MHHKGCNGRANQRLYGEIFLQRLYIGTYEKLGPSILVCIILAVRSMSELQILKEKVLNLVSDNPSISCGHISRNMNVSHTIVLNILHKQQWHPYHPQKIHELKLKIFPQRVEFANWFLQRCATINTEEAMFTRNAC